MWRHFFAMQFKKTRTWVIAGSFSDWGGVCCLLKARGKKRNPHPLFSNCMQNNITSVRCCWSTFCKKTIVFYSSTYPITLVCMNANLQECLFARIPPYPRRVAVAEHWESSILSKGSWGSQHFITHWVGNDHSTRVGGTNLKRGAFLNWDFCQVKLFKQLTVINSSQMQTWTVFQKTHLHI